MVVQTRQSRATGSGAGGGSEPPSPPGSLTPKADAAGNHPWHMASFGPPEAKDCTHGAHPSPLKRQRTPSSKSDQNFAKVLASASPSKRAKSGMQHAKSGTSTVLAANTTKRSSAKGCKKGGRSPAKKGGSARAAAGPLAARAAAAPCAGHVLSGETGGKASMARSEFNKLMEKSEGNCSAGFIDTYMPGPQLPGAFEEAESSGLLDTPFACGPQLALQLMQQPAPGGTAEPAPAAEYQWTIIDPFTAPASASQSMAADTDGICTAAATASLATREGANGGDAAVGAVQVSTRGTAALRPASADSFQRFLCHHVLPGSSGSPQLPGHFEEVESAGLLNNPFACGAQLPSHFTQHLAPDLDAMIEELAESDLEEDDLDAAGPEIQAVAPGSPVVSRPGSAAAAATLMHGHTVPQGFLVDLLEEAAAALMELAPPDTKDDEEEEAADTYTLMDMWQSSEH